MWKFVSPEFVFGPEARHLAGRYARNLGLRKVLIVTDAGVIGAGWTGDVIASLEQAGVDHEVFSGVTPNPRAEEVMAGAEVYVGERCNGIIAVGGGSPMDCAKAIGIVTSNKQHILELEGLDRVSVPGPPLICVPTTGGSSADVSQFAIITDEARRHKVDFVSKALVPDVALIDPVTTITMPPELTASTGIDALTHAMEAFVSTARSPLSDQHALDAIRLITTHLPMVLAHPNHVDLRTKQMLGSLEAGLAFSNAGLGAMHAISHGLGGLLDIAHGECNAFVLCQVVEFNFDCVPEKYRLIGQAMGVRMEGLTARMQRNALLEEMSRLLESAGLERTLQQAGVQKTDIPELARRAANDPCIATNPRRAGRLDVEAILEKAL